MPEPAGSDWTTLEIDLIVADYFAMLNDELAGRAYVKAQRNAALHEIIGRSRKSIEYKHANISAVLMRLGMRWIPGYKPMVNYQGALIDGVGRFLALQPGWWTPPALHDVPPVAGSLVRDGGMLWVGPAPGARNVPPATDPVALTRLLHTFDPAARDAANRTLGKAGEERVLHHEHARLRAEGRDDLARRVRWVAAEDGDGAGYDILSFTNVGTERWIEVKTTTGWERTPFHMTRNECAVASERPDAFRLFRLYDFAREPRAFELAPPLEEHVELTATAFLATLR